MVQSPLAIYLPSSCEVYPMSTQCGPNEEYLVGISNGYHFFLAVPKKWIGDYKGMLLIPFIFDTGCAEITMLLFNICIPIGLEIFIISSISKSWPSSN